MGSDLGSIVDLVAIALIIVVLFRYYLRGTPAPDRRSLNGTGVVSAAFAVQAFMSCEGVFLILQLVGISGTF